MKEDRLTAGATGVAAAAAEGVVDAGDGGEGAGTLAIVEGAFGGGAGALATPGAVGGGSGAFGTTGATGGAADTVVAS